jgi:hypothetical protein
MLEAFVDNGSLALFSPPNSRRSIAVPAVFEALVFQLEPSRWEASETDGHAEKPTERKRRS